jgi:hypothetical protein
MAPFEALYGWQCHTPLNWIEPGESYIWCRHCWWCRSNGTLYSRQLKSCKVMSSGLCKQEMLTFTVWDWRSCVLKGFTSEGRKEVWSERKAITMLHRTIPHTWEVWKCGIQARITTVVGRGLRHLPRILAKEVFEGTHGCYIIESGTTRSRLDISWTSDQDLGPKESCHKAQDNQVL